MKFSKHILVALLTSTSVLLSFAANADNDDKIKVMSRNLYLGADLTPAVEIALDPTQPPEAFPLAVSAVFQTVQTTNFPERAEALADEIERRKPHAIGLQEVSIWSTQIPSDFVLGNPTPNATDVAYDFLAILQAALSARGLDYTAVSTSVNADIELPMIVGVDPTTGAPIFGDLRLTDQDVILVRNKQGVSYANPLDGRFAAQFQVPVGALTLEFTRGYTMTDVTVNGASYRFVNTHLEVGGGADGGIFQALQMPELLGVTAATNGGLPVIMLGDFNSSPSDVPVMTPYGLMDAPYQQALTAGYADVWLEKKRPKDGFTCCFDGLVSDPDAELDQRIDHIFLNANGREVKKVKAKVLGDSNADMTDDSGLYPSDHAGVFAKIKFED